MACRGATQTAHSAADIANSLGNETARLLRTAATMCAQLLRRVYGSRAAADGWQEACITLLVSFGFRQGEAVPTVFHHAERNIVT